MTDTVAELERLAQRQRARMQRIQAAAKVVLAREWRRLDGKALTQSWDAGAGRRILVTLSGAQLAAARGATPYVADAAEVQGYDPENVAGELVAESLAGMASDGRSLADLLYRPLIDVKTSISEGAALDEAMRVGLSSMERIVETQVADAARAGIGVASNAHRDIKWFVRTLTPPSCARCAILAGKKTTVERPFQRHPRCDCINCPVGDSKTANAMVRNPSDYFDSLSTKDQDRIFTKAGAAAIREGADINQIVNARRGMSTTGSWVERLPGPEREGRIDLRVTHPGRTTSGHFTTEGMVMRKGIARQTLALTGRPGARRLTPEGIYALASDRDEILRLLRRFGYLN
jgi:hypothetical protein